MPGDLASPKRPPRSVPSASSQHSILCCKSDDLDAPAKGDATIVALRAAATQAAAAVPSASPPPQDSGMNRGNGNGTHAVGPDDREARVVGESPASGKYPELATMRISGLRRRAISDGVDEGKIDDALDKDDVKGALIALIEAEPEKPHDQDSEREAEKTDSSQAAAGIDPKRASNSLEVEPKLQPGPSSVPHLSVETSNSDGTPVKCSQAFKLWCLWVTLLFGYSMLGALAYHWLEEEWNFLTSLYFTFTAITTVGYGCISPTTLGSRWFTMLYVVASIPVVSGLLGEVYRPLIEIPFAAVDKFMLSKLTFLQTVRSRCRACAYA